MAISYDSLELNISANVSGASRGIKSLQRNLEALQNTVKGLDFGLIDNLQKHLQNIANIDFSNVSQGLRDVVSAFKSLNNAKLRGKGGLEDRPYEPNFTMQESQLPAILQPNFQMVDTLELTMEGWNNFKDKVEQGIDDSDIIEVEAHLKTLSGDLERAGFSYEQIKEVIRSTNAEAKLFSEEGLTKVRDILLQWGYSGEEADRIIKRLKTDTQQAGKNAEKGAKGFQKIVNAFKRIVFYRLVRRAIQLVGQAIKEGIQNMALFDSSFNETMSNLKSSLSYFKNSFATVVAPILQMIEPVLTAIIDGLAEINNLLGEMFSAIAGKDYFAEATKGAEDYAESLKKAKNQALGLDELNVLSADNQAQNFQNASVGIDSSGALGGFFADFGATLKDFLVRFKEGIMPIVEALAGVFDALAPILDFISEIALSFADDTMDGVNEMLTSFVNMIKDLLIYVKKIFDALSPVISIINDISSFLVNGINNSLQFMFETVSSTLPLIEPILTAISGLLGTIFAEDGVVGQILTTFQNFGTSFGELFTGDGTFAQILRVINDILSKIGNQAVKGALGGLGIGYYDLPKWEQVLLGVLSLGTAPLLGLINKHANGGFVEDGLFMANHNELIGQFSNGRTVVANNEMITEGIYRAVLSAMQDSGALGGGNKEVVIQIDGREIAKTVDKYNKQKGNAGFVGGYYNG